MTANVVGAGSTAMTVRPVGLAATDGFDVRAGVGSSPAFVVGEAGVGVGGGAVGDS